jgi:phosphoglycerol transferase MdoB-like AlkP superfamily enzyme
MGLNKKKPWDPRRPFVADYLNEESNPKRANFLGIKGFLVFKICFLILLFIFPDAVQSLFQKYGDSEILFADNVTKLNPYNKPQMRTIIVTDLNIYK